jgi:hypothetical protein
MSRYPPGHQSRAAHVHGLAKAVPLMLQVDAQPVVTSKLGHTDNLDGPGDRHGVNQGETSGLHLLQHHVGARDRPHLLVFEAVCLVCESEGGAAVDTHRALGKCASLDAECENTTTGERS